MTVTTEWKKLYEEKKTSSEKAISLIKSGDRIVVGHAAGEPSSLLEELVNQKDRLNDVEIAHMLAIGPCKYCEPGLEKHFRHNSLFVGPTSRKAVAAKRADFTPTFFSEIPRLFRENILPVDVALIQVSRPDENGYCSYGVSVDYTKAAAESAKVVIAEINSQMPKTYSSFIHISKINCFVEVDSPLIEIPRPKITEVEESIGKYVASLIPDRANLQLGIGAIPDAALKYLTDKKDLGIHTEMFSDGVIDLYEAGVVTNKYNNLNPGKFTACFLIGSKKLYAFVDNNKDINMQPVDYTNKITVAGQVDNLMSINSAMQVDLFGQVCADRIGLHQYSGVGGQVDFVRATSLSPGGKSIIAMPSAAKNNTISKIVSKFDDGACVTTSRHDVEYIVTEYGIANLKGKTVRQRAEALISIAHPDFREKLREEALKLDLI